MKFWNILKLRISGLFYNLRKLCSNYNDFMSYGCHKCTFSFVERILRFLTCCAMAILYSWQYNKEHSLNFVMFKLDTKNIKAALQNFEEIFLYCWWVVHLILSNLKNAIIIITYYWFLTPHFCNNTKIGILSFTNVERKFILRIFYWSLLVTSSRWYMF